MDSTLIRFVILDLNDESNSREGFFQEAYRLRNEHMLSLEDHDKLVENLQWFSDNLDIPKRFNRSSSKGWYRRDRRGICWFKATALEHVSRAQRIVQIMRKNGIEVVQLRTERPGFITFEDNYQVVAEPFNDLAGIK